MAGTYLPAAPAAVCRTCKVEQPVEEFRPAPGMKAGHRSDCRSCDRAKAREWYHDSDEYRERSKRGGKAYRERNPARYRALAWRRLGIVDIVTAEALFRAQGPCDLGCGRKGCVVDHDHETGRVRGWLCRTCNGAIARLGDSPERLLRVAEYAMRGVSVL